MATDDDYRPIAPAADDPSLPWSPGPAGPDGTPLYRLRLGHSPLLVSMRERTELVGNHTRRVLKKRARAAGTDRAEESGGDELVEAAAAKTPAKAAAAGGTGRPSRPTGKRKSPRN